MTDPSLWNQILIWPTLNLLIGFYKLFETLLIPGAFGWAIVALTAVVKILLSPLTNAQLKSSQKMQLLKPKLDELQKKYQNDKVKLQQAQMSLYKQEGINPAAGCLPLLVQMPVFIAVYRAFTVFLDGGLNQELLTKINQILYHPALYVSKLNLTFFGLDLATKPNQWQTVGVGLLLIPPITGILQYALTKMMLPPGPVAGKEDESSAMQKQMNLLMPVMIGFFAFSFPVGLSLYWNSMTLFGIMQQLNIKKDKKAT